MKPFRKTTEDQAKELMNMLKDTAIKWADKHDIGGLSCSGQFSLYSALECAVQQELESANRRH